jgi:hypothetical protein
MTMLGTAPREPTADLVRSVETYFGKRVDRWLKPHTGLTAAQRFVAWFADGSSAFVKAAVDADTERWLRTDHLIMSTIDGDLVPRIVAWIEQDERSVLVLEDLSDAHWPADHFREEDGRRLPVWWKPGQLPLAFQALDRLGRVVAPASLPPLEADFSHEWAAIAETPAPFLALGLCSSAWFDRAIDRLVAAERTVDLSGVTLVHHDVRSDNVCFRGDRVILVDWSEASRGSPRYDLANLLTGCVLEGGPDPFDVMPDGGALAAWLGGRAARRALGETGRAPAWLIRVLKRMAIIDLEWATKGLGLPAWDGPSWHDV